VASLQERKKAQEVSISMLEANIVEERKRHPNVTIEVNPKSPSFQLGKILFEKQQRNKQLQEKNAQLLTDMAEMDSQFQGSKTAYSETMTCLKVLTSRYNLQYKEAFEEMVVAQGGDPEMVQEYENLRERYFNALLLRLKLQYQMTLGVNVDLNVDVLWEEFEMMDEEAWPSALEAAIAQNLEDAEGASRVEENKTA